MREIKFRVWSDNMWLDGGDALLHAKDKDSTNIKLVAGHLLKEYTICQYTGLKDKSGKEIYEGDIVKADWGEGVIAEIMFEDGAFVLGIRDDCYRDMAGEDNNLYYEVIGNIYENPELLK